MTDYDDRPILVTGASGFIALHLIRALLERGARVRGTVRSSAREAKLRATLEKHVDVGDRLEIVQADLTSDEGWAAAVAGCAVVHHVASPLPKAPPKDEDELIVPAREGALRVLRAAAEAGVQRVVMTSSIAAVLYGHARDGSRSYDESDWSQLGPEVGAYEKSKTIAERAAWDFMASLPDGHPMQLVTTNPGLVLGPVLAEDFSTSGEVVKKLMKREMPGCPDVGWAVVDVRDVVEAHLAAAEVPEAAGQRFCLAAQHASMLEIAHILDARYRGAGYRIPLRKVPGWLLRLVGIFDKTAALAVPELGKRQDVDTARARSTLGWSPRSLEEMVGAMGDSMIEYGVV